MKTTLLIICMAIMGAISHTATAQTIKGGPAATKAQKEADNMAKELGLDPKQKEHVYAANLEYEKEVEKLDKIKLTKSEKVAKKDALRQKQLAHLKTVLKPEQYEKVAAKLGGKGHQKPKTANKKADTKSNPKGKK